MRARTKRYHLDAPIVMFVGITFVMGLGALLSQNNLLYFTFGIALAVLLFSGLSTGRTLARLQVTRLALPTATVGEPITLRYRVGHRGRFIPACALYITEIGLKRGRALRVLSMGFLPVVQTRQALIAAVEIMPLQRGSHRLGGINLSTRFPFGILRKSLTLNKPDLLLVRPTQTSPSQDVLRAIDSQRVQQRGLLRARQPESDVVFASLREYVPGDSFRQIAWKPSARRDGFVIRQSIAEGGTQLLVVFLLLEPDPQSSAKARTECEALNESVLSLGAGVLHHASATGFRVGLAIPGIEHVRAPSARSIDALRWESVLLDDLARVRLKDVRTVAQVGWNMPLDTPVFIVRAPGAQGPDGQAGVISITPNASHAQSEQEAHA